jgi:protease-4
MKEFLKFTFATIVGIILSIFVLVVIGGALITAAVSSQEKEVTVKDNSLLVLKFEEQIVDRKVDNPFENIDIPGMGSNKTIGLNQVLANLEKAKKDKRIKGILLNLSSVNVGLASLREIRNALLDYKDSTNFIIAYSDSYSQGAYYLASVADEVYIQPEGGLDFGGLAANITFYTGLFEKLGIEPEIIRHGKFKSAVEPFMYKKMSDENRQQTTMFIGSMWETILSDISKSKNIPIEKLQEFADNVVMADASKAIEYGLVTKALYREELVNYLKEKTGISESKDLNTLSLKDYASAPEIGKTKISRNKIAVIYAQGSISSGEGDNQAIGSETILKALREARKDSSVKAIVFRVNSPGGSALASDIIWNEVKLAKATKPLVVSMGDYAASGGYYISCAADSIFADPTTITGSIGVFGLMFNAEELLSKKLDLSFDGVKTAKHADLGSINRSLEKDEIEIIQGSIEKVYNTFTSHVAEGRHMEQTKVDDIGQGRVWSGKNAIDINLIDGFGGLNRAIQSASTMADITDDYRLVEYPKVKSPLEQILSDLGTQTYFSNPLQKNEIAKQYFEIMDMINKYNGPLAFTPFRVSWN